MRVLTPPEPVVLHPGEHAVFLAGSIDMGGAVEWQGELIAALAGAAGVLLNPRRAHWPAAWTTDAASPEFRGQVGWELAGMERAHTIAFHFAPASRAPITLLELGLAARTGKAIVCCPDGFWRKGNVEVVCATYGIPMVADLAALAAAVRARLAAAAP